MGENGNRNHAIRFMIPYPSTKKGRAEWSKKYGLNAYWAGKHWAQRKNDADYWHNLVHSELRRQGIRGSFDRPVWITFRWNDRLDLDNHAAMGKMIVDALKGAIIRDDNRQHIKELRHTWHDEDWIEVEIEEWRNERE